MFQSQLIKIRKYIYENFRIINRLDDWNNNSLLGIKKQLSQIKV